MVDINLNVPDGLPKATVTPELPDIVPQTSGGMPVQGVPPTPVFRSSIVSSKKARKQVQKDVDFLEKISGKRITI